MRFGKLTLAAVAMVLTGCGDSGPSFERGTVSGKVSYKGTAVTAGNVLFSPAERGPMTITEIGHDGAYSADVVVGKNFVTIQPLDLETDDGDDEGEDEVGATATASNIPEAYGDPISSKLSVTVTTSGNTYDIDMQDIEIVGEGDGEAEAEDGDE